MVQHLLSPVKSGAITLSNRVIMAPLTRSRAGQPGDVPTELNAEYYAQRAGAGLIVTEGTQVSRQGQGMRGPPAFIPMRRKRAGSRWSMPCMRKAGGLPRSYGTLAVSRILCCRKMARHRLH